jgi:hypothetical protein
MPLNFRTLTLQIERQIDLLKMEYSQAPGSILTEDDLKCLLYNKLSRLRALRAPVPTLNHHILGSYVHAELSWYDENGKLRIRPDITIIEPEHMSILHGYAPPVLDFFGSAYNPFPGAPLPSKQYAFGGKAITIELKFARSGITQSMMRLIKEDFKKMLRLFEKLDREGEGESVFSYLVIFNKLPQKLHETPLAKFVRENRSGHRHRILYKSCCPCPGPILSARYSSRHNNLVLTSPPYGRPYTSSNTLE